MNDRKEIRYYKIVPTNIVDKNEYVVPDGKSLWLSKLGGDAAMISTVAVCICWDTEIIFSTHGSAEHSTTYECVGDGVKKLIIMLDNKSANSETIGGYWQGREL